MESFEIEKMDGTKVEVIVRKPTAKDIDEADRTKAAKVAKIIKSGDNVLSRMQVDDFLKKNGIWTELDEKKLTELQEQIATSLNKLRKGGIGANDGRKICVDIANKRSEMVKIVSKRQVFDDSTIEVVADNERINFLTFTCSIEKESGLQFWNSFEDFLDAKDTGDAPKAITLMYKHLYGDTNEFEKRLPENRWLIKYGFVDEKSMTFVDRKTKKPVDRQGNPIDDLNTKLIEQVMNLQGEIIEDKPFTDEDGSVIVFNSEEKPEEKTDEKTPELAVVVT